MTVTDVAIVGAGPAGLFSVFQCGMLGLRTIVFDALPEVGGQCTALYPEKPIYDIPAFESIAAAELIERLVRQAAPFHPEYRLGEHVEQLSQTGSGAWRLVAASGREVLAHAVILAAGAGAFQPNRPDLADLAVFEATGCVSYVVGRREALRGKRVVIAGGGDSAIDWALALSDLAARVSVVHRRDRFRAAPESERRLRVLAQEGVLDLFVPWHLDALLGENGRIEAVRLKRADGILDQQDIAADVLLPFYGLDASLGPLTEWGLNVDGRSVRVELGTCATNLPGVFAVGDVASYPGKHKLILTAFAEAVAVAHAAHAIARPGEVLRFVHSTSRGAPVSPERATVKQDVRRAGSRA